MIDHIFQSSEFIRRDFGEQVTPLIKGKTIIRCEAADDHGDDFLIFHFDDETALCIRYDWIYEWQFFPKPVEFKLCRSGRLG